MSPLIYIYFLSTFTRQEFCLERWISPSETETDEIWWTG